MLSGQLARYPARTKASLEARERRYSLPEFYSIWLLEPPLNPVSPECQSTLIGPPLAFLAGGSDQAVV